MEERRKLERFSLALPTTIEVVEPTPVVTEISSEYLTRNVSSGGAFFLTPNSIPVGTRVKVDMTLKAETLRTRSGFPRMKTRGYVVRTEPDGMAVCFNSRCRVVPCPVATVRASVMAPVSTPSHKNETVCVIGPSRLQNELIARCLEEQGGVKSAAVASLDEARVRFGDIYGRIKLFLWDCEGKNLARETQLLKSVEGLIPRSSYLGFFNVERKSWHHGMALPRQVRGVFFEDSSAEDLTIGLRTLLRGQSCFPVKATAQDQVPGENCANRLFKKIEVSNRVEARLGPKKRLR